MLSDTGNIAPPCRAACIAAALWPQRVRGLLSSDGYAIQDIARKASKPASPAVAYAHWYQSYFNTELGRLGLEQSRNDFCKLLWKLWSPAWHFTEDEYQQTALSFKNPDFIATAIQGYRHRYGNAPGDPALAELEAALARQPVITTPTFVLAGGNDGVEPPSPTDEHRDRFTGWYERRILPNVGHCVPAEAPDEMGAAIETLLRHC